MKREYVLYRGTLILREEYLTLIREGYDMED